MLKFTNKLSSHFNHVNEMQTTFNNVQVKYVNKKPAKREHFLFDKKCFQPFNYTEN